MNKVTNIVKLTVLTAMAVMAGWSWFHPPMAAVPGDMTPKSTYGAVNVTTAAAVAVFTTGAGGTALTGRNAFSVYNNGPNTMWCGFDSSVSNTTGFPVAPATALSIDLTYISSNNKTFYCRADTADQASPANTRWLQVK